MKIVRCKNVRNHFYDSDKYPDCPNCNKQLSEKNKKMSFLQLINDSNRNITEVTIPPDEPKPVPPSVNNDNDYEATQMMYTDSEATQMMYTDSEATQMMYTDSEATQMMSSYDVQNAQFGNISYRKYTDNSSSNTPEKREVETSVSSAAAKKETYDNADKKPKKSELLVGWLVDISGENKGRSFELHFGNNTIGNDANADINIDYDQYITPGIHGIIAYSQANNIFIIDPCGNSFLVWINGMPLQRRAILSAYTVISIGSVELIFVPLCGSEFSWKK